VAWLGRAAKIFSMSLLKRFSLSEKSKFQFGLEAANVFNHRNYEPPTCRWIRQPSGASRRCRRPKAPGRAAWNSRTDYVLRGVAATFLPLWSNSNPIGMNTSQQHFDVVIVGGGSSVRPAPWLPRARPARRPGRTRHPRRGATAAGMGHIVVMDDSEAQFLLTRRSQQLWQALSRELPAAAEYKTTGTLWVAADEEEMEEAARKSAYLQERGVPSGLLSGRELAELEPNLRSGLAGAMLVAEDAVVYPPAVALHLARQAQALGATLLVAKRSRAWRTVLSHWKGRRAPRTAVSERDRCRRTQLHPRRECKETQGPSRYYRSVSGFVRHQLVELGYLKSAHSVTADSVAFNVQPRSTGQLLIGSSRHTAMRTRPLTRLY